MAGKTTTQEAAVLNVLRATNITAPANAYVALFTAAPTDTTGGTEVSGSSYARQLAGFSAPTGGSPSSIVNGAEILFPAVTGSGYTVVAFAIMTASSGGSILYWGTLTSTAIPVAGQARFAAGALTITED